MVGSNFAKLAMIFLNLPPPLARYGDNFFYRCPMTKTHIGRKSSHGILRKLVSYRLEDLPIYGWVISMKNPLTKWMMTGLGNLLDEWIVSYKYLVGGLVAIWIIFPYIGFLIIPIDFHIFQRGGPTTNQISYVDSIVIGYTTLRKYETFIAMISPQLGCLKFPEIEPYGKMTNVYFMKLLNW